VHKTKKELMKNNTKVRLRLSKQLFESLSKQIIAEAKTGTAAYGGYTVPVKGQPKMPKQSKSQAASPEAMMEKTPSQEKMDKGLYKETDLEESQKYHILTDFKLDGKSFKKGQTIKAQPDFDKIEDAIKAGKLTKGEHFKKGVGEGISGGGLRETEKESMKKVMADITALSKEDQAKVKKFISSHSKKSIKEDEGSSRVYSNMGQDTGDSGSSLDFTISKKGRDEDGHDYVDIDYTIIPNSKYRQAGAGSKSPRTKKYGYKRIRKDVEKDGKIVKGDINNGYITVDSENFRLDRAFLDQL